MSSTPSPARELPTARTGGSPAVVAIGGGHGLATTLRAVKTYTDRVTAVVSVADDGGSSGRLRRLLNIIPPGDLRKCLVALAEQGSLLASAFEYRFSDVELAGHALGNLVLAGLFDCAEDPVAALDEACRTLGVHGRVLPATLENVSLKAESEAGRVAGQVAVMGAGRIRSVSLVPADPEAPQAVIEAIDAADQIILGPGSLFTSVLAAVAVPDVRSHVASSAAQKIYVCNLHPQVPETEGFDAGRHLAALADHGVVVEIAVCDSSAMPIGETEVPIVDVPLSRPSGLAHDPLRLARVLCNLIR
ncbi:MAG: gluconeogenesis factor YvcK family protein [Acidimicrobiales bacterium]